MARDWTKGNILHNLLRLSWPMMVTNLVMILGPTIDMLWVGRLGSDSLAVFGVAGLPTMLVMGSTIGLIMGMRAMVARYVGAGDIQGANHVAQQAFVISAVFSAAAALVGIFFTEEILGLFRLEADVVALGGMYLRIMLISTAPMIFRFMAEGIMQASGDAETPMVISVTYRVVHVVLAPFLILGWWIFPSMELAGIGVTNAVSQSLGMIFSLWCLFGGRSVYFNWAGWRRRLRSRPTASSPAPEDGSTSAGLIGFGPARLRLSLRDFRLDTGVIWRMVKIGLPAMVSNMQRGLSQAVLVFFMVPYGTLAVAAHTIAQRLEFFMFMPGVSFGTASATLVGQNLGAGQPERAEKSTWLAVVTVTCVLTVVSLAILFWAENVAGIFNTAPELLALAGTFLRIAVVAYIVFPVTTVFMSALSGAGDTLPPMVVSLVTVWLVVLPLALFLPNVADLGVYGVRWAMISGPVLGVVSYVVYFRMGRWKRKMV